jgi:hypothetical protein
MRFLFVGPGFCLQLPSDSASRRTPLLFSYRFPPSGSEEDLNLQVTNQAPHPIGWRLRATRHAWRTNKKPAPFEAGYLFISIQLSLIVTDDVNADRGYCEMHL